MIFNYDANKTHFHNKGFALSLVFEVRFFGTRKWPISRTRSSNTGTLPLMRKKRVGYRVEWLRHYHIWEILVAFYKSTRQTCSLTCTHRLKRCILRSLSAAFMTRRMTIIFWNFRLGQISHTICWGQKVLEEGWGVKITLIVSCLEWPTCWFLFIMVEYEKVLIYSPDLRMVLIFLVTKVFQKGTVFKWAYL